MSAKCDELIPTRVLSQVSTPQEAPLTPGMRRLGDELSRNAECFRSLRDVLAAWMTCAAVSRNIKMRSAVCGGLQVLGNLHHEAASGCVRRTEACNTSKQCRAADLVLHRKRIS